MNKPPRTHILSQRMGDHAPGIDGMLCGMQSRHGRKLIYTTQESLADCKRCVEEVARRRS